MKRKIKIAVLIGNGGRLRAICNCVERINNAEIVAVVSHKEVSDGIEWVQAQKKSFYAFFFRFSDWKKQGKTRKNFDKELAKRLKTEGVNFVIMAGWNLIISNEIIRYFPKQIINLHPSLCPAFPGPGKKVIQQTLDHGVKITGCTVHFVTDEGVDTGPIILQSPVVVKEKETCSSLQKKIHREEEKILCQAIRFFCASRLKIKGRRVIVD